MRKIIILNILGFMIVALLVLFTNQASITGRVIPSSLTANEDEDLNPNLGIPEVCLNKSFKPSGFFGCSMNDTIWECELTGEGPIAITQTSGSSMHPTITLGTLAILQKADLKDLEICDIVGFRKEGSLFLHRVTEIDNIEGCVTTKGDNNPYTDGCIKEEEIIGKVVMLLEGANYRTQLAMNFTDFVLQ